MATPLQITRDSQGYMTSGQQSGRDFPTLCQQYELTATTAVSITVPVNSSTRMLACIVTTAGHSVFMARNYGTTIVSPTTGAVTTFPVEMIPNGVANRIVLGGDILQFITPDTGVYLTISYYEVPV
jgi:hypothetical protein